MDWEPSAIHIVRLFTQEVEQLGVAHGDQKVKAIVRVAHNEEQGSFPVSQSVQFQLIIGRDFTQLCDVEYSKARTTGNQDRLGCFARNELSRTFYQKNKQQYYLLHYACCVCHLAV